MNENRKVVNVDWFNGTIGIVSTVDTITGEHKAYMGSGRGISEDADVQHILNHGSKIHPHVAKRLDKHLSGGKQ